MCFSTVKHSADNLTTVHHRPLSHLQLLDHPGKNPEIWEIQIRHYSQTLHYHQYWFQVAQFAVIFYVGLLAAFQPRNKLAFLTGAVIVRNRESWAIFKVSPLLWLFHVRLYAVVGLLQAIDSSTASAFLRLDNLSMHCEFYLSPMESNDGILFPRIVFPDEQDLFIGSCRKSLAGPTSNDSFSYKCLAPRLATSSFPIGILSKLAFPNPLIQAPLPFYNDPWIGNATLDPPTVAPEGTPTPVPPTPSPPRQ
ncbi:hypothetical protein OUZ56_030925 [Daphnia magna]|uniref:Uncharacterized protein n=1 Tax=Daphnia magna TaxID=35525 RepID=A0ABQ9ZSR4_9CRUS|nr:hypothetical protein OUZ56_030925 [Daphnia magna]